jgi:DNA polymerase III subunit delta'
MQGIIGHQKQKELLENAMVKNRVAHAYIFTGPAGVGKRTMARKFANRLLDTESDFHPDLIEIRDDSGIKINAIRKLIYQLSLKSYLGKYKVAIIYDAQNLSIEASNALLKALEEPKSNTVIILVTNSVEHLPKTIVSRVQKVNFGLVHKDEIKSLIPVRLTGEQRDLITTTASGRPGLVKKIVEDQDFSHKLASYSEYYNVFKDKEIIPRLLLAQDLASLETTEVKSILEFWLSKLEYELNLTGERILAHKLNQVSKTRKYLDQNLNSKLILSDLMLVTQS